jgi:hypothetical protein
MAVFSIWEGDECGITLGRGVDPPTCGDGSPLDLNAVKVLEFKAASWDEACQRQNDHYGWGRYVPPEPPGWEQVDPSTSGTPSTPRSG